MSYSVNLEDIPISKYRESLESADLIPSQMMLKNNIDDAFAKINQQKIGNVEELRKALSNKQKLQEFSNQSGIAEAYLKILIRHVNGYRRKPNRIKDFPGLAESVVSKLENLGVKNTRQLFDRILTVQSRSAFSSEAGISERDLLTLTKLTDLSRIKWVNHTFAYVLLEAKYDTAGKVAAADYTELYEAARQLNKEKEIYKGNIGLRDMKRCVEAAKNVSQDIEYE